jgi:hypothetical protein
LLVKYKDLLHRSHSVFTVVASLGSREEDTREPLSPSSIRRAVIPTARRSQPAAKVGPKEIAQDLGIEAKTLRVFLRSKDMNVGRGKRYEFTAGQAAKIKSDYKKAHASNGAA